MRKRLHDALRTAAERAPEKTAVVFRGRTMTYGEWEVASNRLARALIGAGCRPGDRVGLLLPKSLEALIGMFGILKADCIYVPLDPASPATRLVRIMESADCYCLLAVNAVSTLVDELTQREAPGTGQIGWMDEAPDQNAVAAAGFRWQDVLSLPGSPVHSSSGEQDIAHILFTSGTTGSPKGVTITHFNVTQFLDWAVPRFGMNSSDRISGHPPFRFDLSTFDIHGTVAVGAELHLVPPELNILPGRLADFIRDSRLTQWFSVPSILTHMAKTNAIQANEFPFLRRLLWCGEKFPTPSLIYWMRRLPDVDFFNLYGPTEATIASSCHRVAECPARETAEIPIGKACGGERLLILDEGLRPVAPGAVGDLYIGGVGLSPGYWRDGERTAEVFRQYPGQSGREARIYKTGDLAREGDDGQLYLLGRSDSQIKSRGYRIELGEIEAALNSLAEVREVAVVAINSESFEGTAICCAWVPAAGYQNTPTSLRKRLSQILPDYMIPSHWKPLNHMPLNGNGKIDRRRLKEQFSQTASQQFAKAPQTKSFQPLEVPGAGGAFRGEAIL